MFPQFGATAESLSKASSLVFRIGSDAHLYDDPDDVSIAPLLDSRFDTEKAEALKRLLALIAQGADVSNFFPHVVKNVASQSLEVKKLVYLYLLHYAERRPNEALLSVNCFQKDLSDTNPLVRAWALRAMAGIRLHAVAPLVLVAASKCARDPSAYVRKCAAHALPKIYDLQQEENTTDIVELIGVLLSDHSPGVVGAAAVAFNSVCPKNLLLIGKKFRKLCETLPDVEEWGQIVLIDILLRYVVSKHGLVTESIILFSNSSPSSQPVEDHVGISNHVGISDITEKQYGSDVSDFKLSTSMLRYYIEGQEEQLSCSGHTEGADRNLCDVIQTSSQNDDVRILLRCTSPLLWSQNSAVVFAAAGVHWIMAPKNEVKRIIKPLLFILRSSNASKYVVLCNIQVFARAVPSLFAPYFEDFFVCHSDSYQIKALKLEILSTIATDSSIPCIFDEFQDYIRDPDRRFVADTVAAIGLCAQRIPSVANNCLEGLLALTVEESSTGNLNQKDGEAGVLVQAIMSIKGILKQDPACHEKVIVRLARILDVVKEPSARALIVWMVGEYNSVGPIIIRILPTILQYLAWCFTSEEVETKQQILNTTTKVVLCAQGEEQKAFKRMLRYIIELGKYDLDYDVRDRAHFIEKLVSYQEEDSLCLHTDGDISHDFAANVFGGSTLPSKDLPNHIRFYLPGSLSQIVLHAAPGYAPLPKPCSLPDDVMNNCSKSIGETQVSDDNMGFEVNDSDSVSGSSVEETGSYDSRPSFVSSSHSDASEFASNSYGNDDNSCAIPIRGSGNDNEAPLLHLSDAAAVGWSQTAQSAEGNITPSLSSDLAELMSKSALESWLDEQPSTSVQKPGQTSSARISITDLGFFVKPKTHMLIDATNSNGLRVDCAFSSDISTVSPLLICVEFTFENCSNEPLMNISVKDGESSGLESSNHTEENPESASTDDLPTILPMEEIASLDPGEAVKKTLQVCFHHHLLPLKLAVCCNNQKYSIKLWPDIGYFIRPLPMDLQAFSDKVSQLRGMFECAKRGTFTGHIDELDREVHSSLHTDKILIVARTLASRMLSNTNVHLVSVEMPVSFSVDDASGLCLRFSAEILSSSKPCLLTITAEGKSSEALDITVKINCEETIFGLNLLNRVATFLD